MSENSVFKIREISEPDIQLLRYWRNNPTIQKFMLSGNSISYEDQINWFKNLDQISQKHFIYSYGDLDIGTFSLTNIDLSKRAFEGGILCGKVDYFRNPINLSGCLYLYHYAFSILKLETATARILRTNKNAVRLNYALGYKDTNASTKKVVHCELTKEHHFQMKSKYISYLQKINLWPAQILNSKVK